MKIIILAGGKGTRLWPISRESFPKQFLKLGGNHSFLQKTVLRFLPVVKAQDILIVTNHEHRHLVINQLAEIDPKLGSQVIVEPARRNTGPAIALAVNYFQEKGGAQPDDCFLVTPSDEFISPEERFLSTFPLVEELTRKGNLVTFGIQTHKPETGYGYLKIAHQVEASFYKVEAFIEKPNLEKAKSYILSGNYLWNSGIFAFQGETFWEEVEKHCPALSQLEPFEKLPDISIDYAIMEKSDKITAVPLNLTWSDVGSWDSVFDLFKKDANQNVKIGNVYDVDTKNSLIISDKRLISTVGLEDVVVIETEDAIFLGKMGESQRVKKVVEELQKKGIKATQEHLTTHRAWGYSTLLEEGPCYKVKRILVNPLQILSLQMDHSHTEHWVVVKGTAKITVGEEVQIVHENESFSIPPSTPYQLENPGDIPLEIIEVLVGTYKGEDDIVPLEDICGRTSTTHGVAIPS